MQPENVRIAEDADFQKMKSLINSTDGWKQEYNKNQIVEWTKYPEGTHFKMLKLKTEFKDVKPALLFDVLLDPKYRQVWDRCMLESYDIGFFNPNNDLGYYAVSCPALVKNRDFILLRSWLETDTEYLLLNHSVYHKDYPPKKGFVRAFSNMTGFIIESNQAEGSKLSYITHSDPRGSLPAWFVNKITHHLAPKTVKRLYKACLGYPQWKSSNNPEHKPWIHPEQINIPRLNISDCIKTSADDVDQEILDETSLEDEKNCNDSEDKNFSE